MKTKRIIWTVVFLSVTLAAIVMECVAGLLHPAGTIPWTEYLARYVPWPFQLAAYVILAVWLPFHFWRHDHLRQAAFKRGVAFGMAQQKRIAERPAFKSQAGDRPGDPPGFAAGGAFAALTDALNDPEGNRADPTA